MYMHETKGKSFEQIIPELMEPYYSDESQPEIAIRFEILIPYLVKNKRIEDLRIVLNKILAEHYSHFDVNLLDDEDMTWFISECWNFLPDVLVHDIASKACLVKWSDEKVALKILSFAVEAGFTFDNIINIYFYPFSDVTKAHPLFEEALTYLYDETLYSETSSVKIASGKLSVVAYAYQTDNPGVYEKFNYYFFQVFTKWILKNERLNNPVFSKWLAQLIKPVSFTVDLHSLIATILYCEDWVPASRKDSLLQGYGNATNLVSDAISRRTVDIFWRNMSPEGTDKILELLPQYKASTLHLFASAKEPLTKSLTETLYEPAGAKYLKEPERLKMLMPSPYFNRELNLLIKYYDLVDTYILDEMNEFTDEVKTLLTEKFNFPVDTDAPISQLISILSTLVAANKT